MTKRDISRAGAGRGRAAGALLLAALMVPRLVEATVAEQRARLPPAADCRDPITGTWKALYHYPRYRDWGDWTLKIERSPDDPTQLLGTITNHFWDGGPQQTTPPVCKGRIEAVVVMDAVGWIQGQSISFQGVGKYRVEEKICGKGFVGYNLDHFTGVVDYALHEFQSVNNDGGAAVNEPTLFRRVRCSESEPPPSLDVEPPPFYPPVRGCM